MLNWLTRYAAVAAELPLDERGQLTQSVLDVGCGPHGLAVACAEARFAGVDVTFPGPVSRGMFAVRSEPGPLPFADHAFDTVICLDVLEHVPPAERASFVTELTRVAARRVLIACPSDEGHWIDAMLRKAYGERGLPAPAWLDEHDEHGLPSARDIERICSGHEGFDSSALPMTNGLLSTLAVMADMLPEFADRASAEYATDRAAWLELFGRSRFGSCYRKGYAIERRVPAPALVGARTFDGDIWEALRPACCEWPRLARLTVGGRGIDRPGEVAACVNCGHRLTRDGHGAIAPASRPEDDPAPPAALSPEDPAEPASPAADQAPSDAAKSPPGEFAMPAQRAPMPATRAQVPALVPIASTAARRLLLSPDWENPPEWLPVVARYVAGADPEGDHVLCLDASRSPVGVEPVHQMLMIACEAISAGAPFASLLLLDAPFSRDGLIPVSSPQGLADALGLPPVGRPIGIEDMTDHARAVKRLLDAVRAVAERARYLAEPDPWVNREPLVSVRIPTWKGHEMLASRAIPSVLGGAYQNFEVVVCSDGPDPLARRAVEGFGDARVRYVELPERPVYPQQPWSFWETAGIHAVNRALDECRGAFIAPLDHDDAFTDDHLQLLLSAASSSRADMVYGQALMQDARGMWRTCGQAPLTHGEIAHGSVLYSCRLAHLRLDADCWLLSEPGDWNMWRRITATGAQTSFVPRVVLAHFKERRSIESGDRSANGRTLEHMTRRAEDVVADVHHTGLDWLLDVPLGQPALR